MEKEAVANWKLLKEKYRRNASSNMEERCRSFADLVSHLLSEIEPDYDFRLISSTVAEFLHSSYKFCKELQKVRRHHVIGNLIFPEDLTQFFIAFDITVHGLFRDWGSIFNIGNHHGDRNVAHFWLHSNGRLHVPIQSIYHANDFSQDPTSPLPTGKKVRIRLEVDIRVGQIVYIDGQVVARNKRAPRVNAVGQKKQVYMGMNFLHSPANASVQNFETDLPIHITDPDFF